MVSKGGTVDPWSSHGVAIFGIFGVVPSTRPGGDAECVGKTRLYPRKVALGDEPGAKA